MNTKQSFGDFQVFFNHSQKEIQGALKKHNHSEFLPSDTFQSPNKLQLETTDGDKFEASQENTQHPALVFQKVTFPSESCQSLMPRTLNYTKTKQAITNLETAKAFNELGIEML